MLAILLLLLLSPSSLSAPAGAEIIGQATVIDGDTIEIHGQRIRLHGVDAPESRQLCADAAGREYACGREAAFALADWIARSVVSCRPTGKDRYRRAIAVCTVRGDDMSRWMVRGGRALAFRRYSIDYVPDEEQAQAAKSGVWQGRFVPPWDWRKGIR